MSRLLVLPVAVPLLAAALTGPIRGRVWAHRVLGYGASLTVLGYAIALVVATADGSVLVTQVGGWPPGFAIAFAADLFSALMLVVAALMVLVCTAFAAARGEDVHPLFHPLVLVLAAGIGGAFLTADLFNLFVFFEVMLIASYVLVTLGRRREQIRGGAIYIASNLFGSSLLLAGVALLYGATGTVNMALLSRLDIGSGPEVVAGSLLLVAFGVKSALVPVHGWIGRAYPAAPPAVAALFSGLLTKVGVYAMYRVGSVVFGGEAWFLPLLLVVGAVTMVVGVLAALGGEGMREILSIHIVSQIGYMIVGLGLFGPLGLAAGIFYVVNQIAVKTSLFLSAGAVETLRGTGALSRLGGMARAHPVLSVGFAISALSLAGLPPFSGFFAKFAIVRAAFVEGQWIVGAVAIAVGFLTLTSMIKVWNGVFWGRDEREREGVPGAGVPVVAGGALSEPPSRGRLVALVAPSIVLALWSVGLGLGAEGMFALADRAAAGLLDTSAYVQAVLGS